MKLLIFETVERFHECRSDLVFKPIGFDLEWNNIAIGDLKLNEIIFFLLSENNRL